MQSLRKIREPCRARHRRARSLIKNIVGSLKETPRRIQELPIQHFYKADANYGMGVAKGLGLNASRIFANGARTEEKLVPATERSLRLTNLG